MNRLHVSFSATDLDKSVAFYETLFGTPPTTRRDGYAKWMLDDPRVNFVVEQASDKAGFSHMGIQVEEQDALEPMFDRMKQAEAPYLPEGTTTCCYHKSEKSWTSDPDGVMWEAFFTHHETEERGAFALSDEEVQAALAEQDAASTPLAKGCGCC